MPFSYTMGTNGKNADQTDTGTGSYGKTVSQSSQNGVNKWVNNITGTTRYGAVGQNGVTYPGGVANQNALKNQYNGVSNPRSSGGTAVPEWGGYSGGESNGQDDVLAMIKDLLNQQKIASDNMYKSQYEQALANNRQSMENNRNQINLNYARGDRYLKGLYGDSLSGQGLSNRVRNNAVWQSSLASNRQNFANNNATALSQYNAGLANNASTLAQGWYNYVMPIYTNRQQNTDDYAYRRYLATL